MPKKATERSKSEKKKEQKQTLRRFTWEKGDMRLIYRVPTSKEKPI